jgi:Fe2+ or Zn2+ uptake regulation protein
MTAAEVRSTPQRRAVLEAVRCADDHPTAAEILSRVLDVMPGVGAATVYRTLAMLVESGQIQELRLGSSAARYDRNNHCHDHLVCDGCGKVVDVHVDLEHSGQLAHAGVREHFQVTGYDLRIHGRCADCSPITQPEGVSVVGPERQQDPRKPEGGFRRREHGKSSLSVLRA